jgi:hypothetical protein
MNEPKSKAQNSMRSDIHAAIRHNLHRHGEALSRYHVVEVLASVLSGQLEIIRDDARNKRIE